MKRIVIFLLAFFFSNAVSGQSTSISQSFSISASFPGELKLMGSYNLHLRTIFDVGQSISGGPIVDLKVALFKNHLGSSHVKKGFDGLIATSIGGLVSSGNDSEENLLPIFTSTIPSGYIPGRFFNIGFATSYVVMGNLSRVRKPESGLKYQRVGNLFASIGRIYLNYLNDGGPPPVSHLGDGEDRFWTGGASLGTVLISDSLIHNLELSFHKFTGFSDKAYQASGVLFIDNVIYNDIEQVAYNRGRYSVKYAIHDYKRQQLNFNGGYAVSLNFWNYSPDIQDYLHNKVTSSPYHPQIGNEHIDIEIYRTLYSTLDH